MKNLTKISLSLMVIFIALLFLSTAVHAIPDQYELIWWSVDCGGGVAESDGGQYSLTTTIGQPDAGVTMSGGNYDMGGGFFGDAVPDSFPLYLPLIINLW